MPEICPVCNPAHSYLEINVKKRRRVHGLTVISIPELRFSIRRFLLYMDLRVGFDPNEHLKVK